MRTMDVLRLAGNSLTSRKLRTALTTLGIVIGVLSVVSIVALGEGIQSQVGRQLGRLGANAITVTPGFSRAEGGFGGFGGGGGGGESTQVANLTDKDVAVVRATAGIQDVDGLITGRATVQYRTGKASLSLQGVDPAIWKDMTTATLEAGRYLEPGDADVAVLGANVAHTVFGSPVTLNQLIIVANHQVRVVGILQSVGGGPGSGGDNSVYLPRATAAALLDKPATEFSSIQSTVLPGADAVAVGNATTARLLLSRHETATTQDFSVQVPAAFQSQVQGVQQTLTTFLTAIAGVSLLVGAIMIVNTMFMAVMERARQIGILKALGVTNGEVRLLFVAESAFIGLIGGVVGGAASWTLAYVLANVNLRGLLPGGGGRGGGGGGSALQLTVPMDLILWAVLGATLIGAVAGVLPANRAARLQPVETLRAE